MLALALVAALRGVAVAALPDRLQIVADDAELGERIARSARQEHPGGVEVAPAGAAGRVPPRTLRLTVRQGPGRLWLVLSLRRALRVQRAVPLPGAPSRLDVAEVAAISLSELRARLDELQASRADAHESEDEVEPEAPAAAPPAPAPPPSASRAPAPAPVLTLAPRPAPWRLAVGVPTAALGAAVLSLGIASVALDGRCFDAAVPCAYRYDTLRPGIGELALGGAALAAGAVLIALDLRARRGPPRLALAPGPGLGLALAGGP